MSLDSHETALYLSDKSLAKRYEASRASIWRWVKEGRLPAPIKIAGGTTRWKRTTIEAWEAQQEANQ